MDPRTAQPCNCSLSEAGLYATRPPDATHAPRPAPINMNRLRADPGHIIDLLSLLPRRYRAALDAALASGRPEVVASVLGELAARAGLAPALGGRDAGGLAPLLGHLARHIADPRHTRLLAGVAHRLLDAYGSVVRRRCTGCPAARPG